MAVVAVSAQRPSLPRSQKACVRRAFSPSRRSALLAPRCPIADRAVLVTGANRGIGQALVEEALRRGAT
ncbi:MAG: hypothetical protein ACXVA3_18460, partial [Vulcanimicrobiaceae bacterium]